MLGSLLVECDRYPEAIAELKQAVAEDNDDMTVVEDGNIITKVQEMYAARYRLVQALYLYGNFDEARDACHEALARTPVAHQGPLKELLKQIEDKSKP